MIDKSLEWNIMNLLTRWSVEGSCHVEKTEQIILSEHLEHVSETGLLTLFCRAIESQSANSILNDEKAVELARRLLPVLSSSGRESLQRLAKWRIPTTLVVHIALRAKKYDEIALAFLKHNPNGIIVNLGCGLDSRFFRIDNGQMIFFDLDLPEVIQCKRQFWSETPRYHMIGDSVFKDIWMDEVASQGNQPVLFIAEGLFMYLEAAKVRPLVVSLCERFPGSELVCEVVNRRMILSSTRWMVRRKLHGNMKIGAQAEFRFGVSDSREMETWSPGIRLLEEWSYFESNHPKLGVLGWLSKIKFFRHVQWTVHYRLG